jgi:hypothetical protein
VIPDILLDDHVDARLESVTWAESSLILVLEVFRDKRRWRVTCSGASYWRLEDRCLSGLEEVEDDPVLWRSQSATYSTYFKGRPLDANHAACDLSSAIPRDSRVLGLTPNRLSSLLSTGNGCLGSLPIPAIRVCETVLQKQGVLVYHLGKDESETSTLSKALFFGDRSYVVAERFEAERLD